HGRMVRASLLRLGADDHVLLLSMHHIASDGWSLGVLMRELSPLYEAYVEGRESPLPELAIQYADYAEWQRTWLSGEELERQLDYWRERLGDVPPLDLPADRPRQAVQTHRGETLLLEVEPALTSRLRELSRREGVTLFMTLLAGFQVLLGRYTGQADVAVGSPVANRTREETEGLIGFFVNTLVMRTDLSGRPSFREVLGRVREVTLGAYAHQDLPFEKVVAELQPERDLSRNPLFQVMFQLLNAPGGDLTRPGLRVGGLPVTNRTAKFDLFLNLSEWNEGVLGWLEYSTDLFERETVERLMGRYAALLEAVAEAPEARTWELLGEEERRELLAGGRGVEAGAPGGRALVGVVGGQAGARPGGGGGGVGGGRGGLGGGDPGDH